MTISKEVPNDKEKLYEFYRVEKMRFAKLKDGKTADKSRIIFNHLISVDVPLESYEYVVNGKSAIEWVMERYAVTTDKKSLIKNDANDWGREMKNPRYALDVLLSVICVSIETCRVVKELPPLRFSEKEKASEARFEMPKDEGLLVAET